MEKKIKEISEKLSDGTFSKFYPIGANAVDIDMDSGNNLEEEMHLGRPAITLFDTDEATKTTYIIEEYRKDESQLINYYKMITSFVQEASGMTILQKLYFVNKDAVEELKKTKKVIFDTSSNSLKIKEEIS